MSKSEINFHDIVANKDGEWDEILHVASRKGYHGMFHTVGNPEESMNHAIRMAERDGCQQQLVPLQQVVNSIAIGIALELNEFFKLIDEENMQELSKLRASYHKPAEQEG